MVREENGSFSLAELVTANNDNRVAILPCSCGAKLYTTSAGNITLEHTVTGFTLKGNEVSLIDTDIEIAGTIYQRSFEISELNKSFFLTREEYNASRIRNVYNKYTMQNGDKR